MKENTDVVNGAILQRMDSACGVWWCVGVNGYSLFISKMEMSKLLETGTLIFKFSNSILYDWDFPEILKMFFELMI